MIHGFNRYAAYCQYYLVVKGNEVSVVFRSALPQEESYVLREMDVLLIAAEKEILLSYFELSKDVNNYLEKHFFNWLNTACHEVRSWNSKTEA